jgi:hypothetical protein
MAAPSEDSATQSATTIYRPRKVGGQWRAGWIVAFPKLCTGLMLDSMRPASNEAGGLDERLAGLKMSRKREQVSCSAGETPAILKLLLP